VPLAFSIREVMTHCGAATHDVASRDAAAHAVAAHDVVTNDIATPTPTSGEDLINHQKSGNVPLDCHSVMYGLIMCRSDS